MVVNTRLIGTAIDTHNTLRCQLSTYLLFLAQKTLKLIGIKTKSEKNKFCLNQTGFTAFSLEDHSYKDARASVITKVKRIKRKNAVVFTCAKPCYNTWIVVVD